MTRFLNIITSRSVGARTALRRLSGLALALAMMPSAFAECGCQDGIDISVGGTIDEFKVAGAVKGPAPSINVEMKPEKEYDFSLTMVYNPLVNPCPTGWVDLECGMEYQLPATEDNPSPGWIKSRKIPVNGYMGYLEPSSFRLRMSKGEDQTEEEDDGDDDEGSGGGGGGGDPEVPGQETEPKVDPTTGNVIQAGMTLSIPLGSVGLGSGGSAPFRSAGILTSDGPITSNLAKPTSFVHIAGEEIVGRSASIWGPALPALVTYTTPSGYAQEKHLVTPTRLFRVTGYNVSPGTGVAFSIATNTYVREYARLSSSETVTTTLGRSPVNWWTIAAITDGVLVTQSYKGNVRSKQFVSDGSSLTVVKGPVSRQFVCSIPSFGADYYVQTEKSISGTLVEKRLQTFTKVDGIYKLSVDTVFPAATGGGLSTYYYYYPSGASVGKLWFTKLPTQAWKVYEYPGSGDTVVYSPFASEATVNTSHTTVSTLPLLPSAGFTTSTARIRRTISSSYGSIEEYVVSLADAATPNAGVLVKDLAASGLTSSVANTSTDSITDGIALEGNDETISYSYSIPASSSYRWLAGLPILRRSEDGKARYYEYQLVSGVFTTTETTGFSAVGTGTTATVGNYGFDIVSNLSERTVTTKGVQGVTSRETLYHTGSGFTRGRLEELSYQDGRYHRTLVDGIETHRVDWTDTVTKVEKDAEGRIITSKFDADGVLLWTETGAGGGVGTVRTTYDKVGLTTTTRVNGAVVGITVMDLLGRVVSKHDQAGTVIDVSYPNGGRDHKSTLPGGVEKLEERYLDGTLKSRSGTGWVAEFHSLEVDPYLSGYQEVSSTGSASGHTARKQIEYYDYEGRLTKSLKPSAAASDHFVARNYGYNQDTLHYVTSEEVDSDGYTTRTLPSSFNFATYDDMADPVVVLGGEITQGLDLDGNWELSFGSSAPYDRFTKRETSYVLVSGVVYRKVLDYRYPDPTGANPLITETLDSLGFIKVGSDSYSRISKVTDPSIRTLTTTTLVTPATAAVVTTEDDSATTASVDTRTTQINGYVQTVEKAGGGANETYQYDSFGRVIGYTDPRNALTISYYDGRFLLSSITNQLGQTTKYSYYSPNEKSAGKMKTVSLSGGRVETTVYNDRDQPTLINGSGTYPKLYGYDGFGDQVTLETYGTSTAVTRWEYQPSTGLLAKKRYDDVHKTAGQYDFQYTYTPEGKLATRTTSRGVVTTYAYDDTTRDLSSINYIGDSNLTPDVTFSSFDGLGRPKQVSEARTGSSGAVGTDTNTGTGNYTTTQNLAYDPQTGAVSITYNNSHRWLKNVSLIQTSPSLGRPTGFEVKVGSTPTVVSSQAYTYDAASSRLSGVSSPYLSSALTLLPGAETVQGINVSLGANYIHSRSLAVDLLGRIVGVRNNAGSSTTLSSLASVATIGHQYDAAGRRGDASREDGTRWNYTYNTRSEVTGAEKRTAGNDLVPGLNFGYTYDDMGNRLTSTSGTGSGVSPRTYGSNALNQYTSLTHDGKVNVLARADVSLTANTPTNATHNGIDAQGNLYGVRQTASTTSSNGKLVTTPLKRSGSTGDLTVQNVLTWVPPTTFTPTYDADGNLTYDGRWTYIWDGENQLVTATNSTTTVKYAYDWMGRRIGSSLTQAGTTTHQSYCYDGWNPVAEWTRTNLTVEPAAANLQRTHLWGPDIGSSARATFGSQSDLQVAGGVGGLIASTHHDGSTKAHFIPSYDANGNIIAWSDGSGVVVQKKDYDPFGNAVLVENFTTTATTLAKLPTYAFSTKPQDAATGLYYYGYRYYDPVTGRWSNRDLMQERAGLNMYVFVENGGPDRVDILGLLTYNEAMIAGSDDARAKTKASIDPNIGEESGKEYCGLICKCGEGSDAEFKPTSAHSGPKPLLRQFLMDRKFVWKRIAPATCDPTYDYETNTLVSCKSQFGKEWKLVAGYHSHPANTPFSGSDDGFLDNGLGFGKVTPDGKIEVVTEGGRVIVIRPPIN